MAGEYNSYFDAAAALPQADRDSIARILMDRSGTAYGEALNNYGLEYGGLINAAAQQPADYWAGTNFAQFQPASGQGQDAAQDPSIEPSPGSSSLANEMWYSRIPAAPTGETIGSMMNQFGIDPTNTLYPYNPNGWGPMDRGQFSPIPYLSPYNPHEADPSSGESYEQSYLPPWFSQYMGGPYNFSGYNWGDSEGEGGGGGGE